MRTHGVIFDLEKIGFEHGQLGSRTGPRPPIIINAAQAHTQIPGMWLPWALEPTWRHINKQLANPYTRGEDSQLRLDGAAISLCLKHI
jgi:hypothetical protein